MKKALERVEESINKAEKHNQYLKSLQEEEEIEDRDRQEELSRLRKDFEDAKENDEEKYDKEVKDTLEISLLRMTENLVATEMRVEELEVLLEVKDQNYQKS